MKQLKFVLILTVFLVSNHIFSQTAGTDCSNAILIDHIDKAGCQKFDISNNELWLKFTATDQNMEFIIYEFSIPVQIWLYEGTCNNLSETEYSSSNSIKYSSLVNGNQYHLKISVTTSEPSIFGQLYRSISLDCNNSIFTTCNKIYNNNYNGDYTMTGGIADNAFNAQLVYGWYGEGASSFDGVDLVMDGGEAVMRLSSPMGHCPFSNGTAYTCSDLKPNVIYKLEYDAKFHAPSSPPSFYVTRFWAMQSWSFTSSLDSYSDCVLHIPNNNTWNHYEALFTVDEIKDMICMNGLINIASESMCGGAYLYMKNIKIIPLEYLPEQICSGESIQLIPECMSEFLPASSTLDIDFSWSPSATLNSNDIPDPIANPTTPIDYTLTLDCFYDSDDHTYSINTNINVIDNGTSLHTETINICELNLLTLTAPINDANSYSWSTGASSQSITINEPGTYTCQSNFGSCTHTDVFEVEGQSTINNATIINSERTRCDEANGSVSINIPDVTSGYSYTFNGTTTALDASNTPFTISNLYPGEYIVTITSPGGCQQELDFNIIPESSNSITDVIFSNTNTSCSTCDAVIKITSIITNDTHPVYNFQFSGDNSISNQTLPISYTALCLGEYNVTITNNSGCVFVQTIDVEEEEINLEFESTNISCNGNTDGSATVIPDNDLNCSYTYLWSNGATGPTITNLPAGIYEVTVTSSCLDSNGEPCISHGSITIVEPEVFNISSVVTNVLCHDGNTGEIKIEPNGGTHPITYTWDNGLPSLSEQEELTAGTYEVTAIDINGCTSTLSIEITEPTEITANTNLTNPTCYNVCNGSASYNVSGGTPPYNYEWNTSPVQTNATAVGLCEGNYYAEITDANGCVYIPHNTISIEEPSELILNFINQTNVSCFGGNDGTAIVNVTGGTPPYSYNWSNGETSNSATNLSAQNYTVIISDVNHCHITVNFHITQPQQLEATPNPTPVSCVDACDGEAAYIVTGGTAPYSYTWFNGATTPTLTGLCAGTYGANVTDINGCMTAVSYVNLVAEPLPLMLTFEYPDPGCRMCRSGEQCVRATVTGGIPPYTMTGWSSTSSINEFVKCVKCDRSYMFTATDANGCTITEGFSCYNPWGRRSVEVDGYEEIEIIDFEIYPNPNKGNFNIKIEGYDESVEIEVTNTLGSVILKQTITGTSQIDISEYSEGIYFVKTTIGEELFIEKIIKQ